MGGSTRASVARRGRCYVPAGGVRDQVLLRCRAAEHMWAIVRLRCHVFSQTHTHLSFRCQLFSQMRTHLPVRCQVFRLLQRPIGPCTARGHRPVPLTTPDSAPTRGGFIPISRRFCALGACRRDGTTPPRVRVPAQPMLVGVARGPEVLRCHLPGGPETERPTEGSGGWGGGGVGEVVGTPAPISPRGPRC